MSATAAQLWAHLIHAHQFTDETLHIAFDEAKAGTPWPMDDVTALTVVHSQSPGPTLTCDMGRMTARITIDVDIVAAGMTPEIASALVSLASVMVVQTEEDLWTLGHPDSEADVPNNFVAPIAGARLKSVTEVF